MTGERLAAIAPNLQMGADGIWYARNRSPISYPEEGNQNCLELEEDSFWFVHRNRCIATVVKAYPPPGLLFDVGGGNGYVSLGLQSAGVATVLVEPGENGVQIARRRGVRPIICSTLEDAGFQPGALPAVGLFDVLEHMQDDTAFLRTLRDLLVPDGRVYLTVPAYPLLWSADDAYAGHFRRYTLSALRRTFQAAGLEVEFATYFFALLPLPIFLGRALPSRLGLRRGNEWDRYQKEHSSRSGVTGSVLNWVLNRELAWLQAGHVIPLGGSCLLVAKKR
jgi:SAM-dependent methyltransferase